MDTAKAKQESRSRQRGANKEEQIGDHIKIKSYPNSTHQF
jgi:hypothetical protein